MVIIILRKIILGLPYFRYTILFKLFIYGISLACEDLGISGPMNRWSMTIASLRNTVDKYGCLQPGISLNGHWNREHHDNPLKLGYPFIQTNQTDWSSSACQWATWYIISRSAYFIDSHIYLFFRSFLKSYWKWGRAETTHQTCKLVDNEKSKLRPCTKSDGFTHNPRWCVCVYMCMQ